MSKLVHRRVILAKIEGAHGTDSVPVAGTNAILCETVAWATNSQKMNKRPAVRASLAQLQQIFGGTMAKITVACELKGSGTAGTAPEIGPLLRACGLAEAIVGGTSVTYAPSSDSPNHDTITIYLYEDGLLWKFVGCKGTATFDFNVHAQGKVSFSFDGHISSVTDSALVTPTYKATVPVPFINVPFLLGGAYSALINALKFDLGNTIAMPPAVQATDGFGLVQITQRNVKGSIDPELDTVAARDFFAMWKAGTTEAMTTGAIGAVAGNIITVTMPKVYYSAIAPGDREGLITRSMSFEAIESAAGDDELSIAFT
jgi:hypothetical protein